jgi:uncharacterized protein YndB with AHSA1/START domain
MKDQSFTTTFVVERTPEDVFTAITNVRGWWIGEPGIVGKTDKLGDEFTYRQEDLHYSKQRITELVPGKKVAWLVLDSKLSFIEDEGEWKGTSVTFEISKKRGKTEVRFTHVGLVPAIECYDACSGGWDYYISGSLHKFISQGKGPASKKVERTVKKATR